MNQPQPQQILELEQAAEEARTAWYSIKGTMEATDCWNEDLVNIYKDTPERLNAKRLENYEQTLKTLRDLIAQHAP